MSGFVVPQFPLECQIYTGAAFASAPRLTSPCNLAWGKRTNTPGGAVGSEDDRGTQMVLLLPALTDVRDQLNDSGRDGVQCPSGSGRYYLVIFVDDLGKGFDNEHRGAAMEKTFGPGPSAWPTPIP